MRARGGRLTSHVLWLVLPPAVLVLGVAATLTATFTHITVENAALERVERENDRARELVENRIESIVEQAQFLATNDLVVNGLIDTEFRDSYLTTFFQSLRVVGARGERITLTDYRGRTIVGNSKRAGAGSTTAWLDAAMTGKTVVNLSRGGLLVAAPVLSHGLAEGAILIEFDFDAMQNVLHAGYHLHETAVFDSHGRALYTSNHSFVMPMQARAGRSADWIESGQDMDVGNGLKIVTAQSRAEALAAVAQVNRGLLAAFALTVSALVGGIAFATRLAVGPVRSLAGVVQSIRGAEDLARRVEEDGPAEVRALATNFNAMLAALESTTTSRDYIDGVVNSMNQVLVVSTADGRITSFNPAARRLLDRRGVTNPTLITEAVLPREPRTHAEILDYLAAAGDGGRSIDVTYRDLDGREILIRWSKSTLRIGVEEPRGTVLLGEDITDRYHAERVKAEFVSTVSHELRTPLTSIKAALGLIRSSLLGKIPGPVKNLVEIAYKNSNRLVLLVNDILDIEKLQAGQLSFEMADIDIAHCIDTAIAESRVHADANGVTLERLDVDESVDVIGDENRIVQVLANLLSNAIKFSPAGGTVTVNAERRGVGMRVAVRDEGPGIAPDLREKIFEKFVQADSSDARAAGGTGLGLAIVEGIVASHGGTVGVDSLVGAGSTFYFELPARALTESPSRSALAPVVGGYRARNRLLSADPRRKSGTGGPGRAKPKGSTHCRLTDA